MRTRFLVVIAVAAVFLCGVSSAQGQSGEKSAVVGLVSGIDRCPLPAMVIDKLFTLNLPPDVWSSLTVAEESAEPRHTLRTVGDTMITVASNMGWGDLVALDRDSTNDGQNPLLPTMVDSWKGRLSCTITMPAGMDADAREKAWGNIAYLLPAMGNTAYCKSRSGKFLLVITVNPKATDLGFRLSKDGTTYAFDVPVHGSVSQFKVQEFLQSGN